MKRMRMFVVAISMCGLAVAGCAEKPGTKKEDDKDAKKKADEKAEKAKAKE